MNMKTKYIIALAAGALALAGCQKNGYDTDYAVGDSVIRFSPMVAHNASATKGALINNNDNGDRSDIAFPSDKNFHVTAWTSGIVNPDFGYTKVVSRGSGASQYWITVFESGANQGKDREYLWKSGENKTFYAYANLPASGASVSSTLVSNKPVQTLKVTTIPATSTAQTDILLGYYTNGTTPKTNGLVPIKFSHPMTAVKFKLGTLKRVSTFVINSISIKDVYASGTAVMTQENAAATKPEDRFTWTPTGKITVSQAIGTQPTKEAPEIGEAFLLIPQIFSSSTALIAIACTIEGASRTLYWPLDSGEWKAGYTNTYTINYEGSIGLYLSSYSDGGIL